MLSCTESVAVQFAAFLLMTTLPKKKKKRLSSKPILWLGNHKHLPLFIEKRWSVLFSSNFKEVSLLVSTSENE